MLCEEIMTVMLSSQGIGLITVIAVSGCSVMLLVLGRQKLMEAKKEENSGETTKALGPLSCVDSLKNFSFSPSKGTISWRINFDVSQASAELQKSSQKMLKPACRASRKPSPEKGNPVKKVRFSEDVIEPSGDNGEYRRRHALASRSGQLRSSYDHDSQTMSSNSTNCSEKKRAQTMSSNSTNCSEKKRAPVSGECRMQTLGKPSMPQNRRALYNGIFHDRAQRSLLY